jgi:hypothetical protein
MNNPYGRAGGIIGGPFMGGGKKTRVISPVRGKTGISKEVPEGIGGFSVDSAPGDKFKVRRRFAVNKTIILPAEKLKKSARRGYTFQKLVHIYPNSRLASVTGKSVYPYLHKVESIARQDRKGEVLSEFFTEISKAVSPYRIPSAQAQGNAP